MLQAERRAFFDNFIDYNALKVRGSNLWRIPELFLLAKKKESHKQSKAKEREAKKGLKLWVGCSPNPNQKEPHEEPNFHLILILKGITYKERKKERKRGRGLIRVKIMIINNPQLIQLKQTLCMCVCGWPIFLFPFFFPI